MFLLQFAGALLSIQDAFLFCWFCHLLWYLWYLLSICPFTLFLPLTRIIHLTSKEPLPACLSVICCSLQTIPFLFLPFTLLVFPSQPHVKGMQFHPFFISPLVYSGKGGGGVGGDEIRKKREGSPLINLELEVGGFGGQSCVIKQEGENILFTAAQLHELYQQVVIFKYLSSGLAVPFHLVLPIWKSVSTGFRPQEFVHRSIMDPEPGRCRRTDGKKWRCYGSVVPDQKYCERHMHRGSQRSRKLVEASKDFLKSNTEHLIPNKSRSSIISSRTAVSNGRISVPVSTTLDLAAPSASVEVGVSSISYKSNSEGSSTDVAQVDRVAAKSSLPTRNESHWNDSLGNRNSAKPLIAAELGVSPKSVLQGGIGTDYRKLSFDNKTGIETEALRCRRTDGKRWRCSRDVVPDKKYCENHLHRGAKKPMVDSRLINGAPGASSVHKAATYIMPEKVKKYKVLDTNLSMSIATSPRQMFDSDSSSSDATTVSDENVQFHRL